MSNEQNIQDQVLDCEIQDSTGLNDFQKLPNQQKISIPQVGINRFRIPLLFQKGKELTHHDAEATMGINLSAEKTGINMSRLCSILQEETLEKPINSGIVKKILDRYQIDLKDNSQDQDFEDIYLRLAFNYSTKQPSLKSSNWGWQYYPAQIIAEYVKEKGHHFFLKLQYEYSSTCPCSLSMAKQYEKEYAQEQTHEGSGMASAHSQRSTAQVTVEYDIHSDFWIDSLIQHLRSALPTETQSLVKRIDEQAFAILNGENPMFVEHAVRRIYTQLNSDSRILDWKAQVEHHESLHSHNAAASICKGIPGGLRAPAL